MAFAKPLVITVNAVAKTLQLINQDNNGSEYYLRETTGSYRVKIRHSLEKGSTATGRVHRSNIELTYTKFAVAPSVLDDVTQVYTVFRHGDNADAVAAGNLGAALSGLMVQARYEDLVGWLN